LRGAETRFNTGFFDCAANFGDINWQHVFKKGFSAQGSWGSDYPQEDGSIGPI
jgi:hypothetical protein